MTRKGLACAVLALVTLGLASPAAAEELPRAQQLLSARSLNVGGFTPDTPRSFAPLTSLGVKVEGGASYRRIFSLPVTGGEGALAFGSRPAASKPGVPEPFVRVRYGFGRTEDGLAVHVARAGAQIDVPIGRLRPWISADAMWLGIDRFTEHGLVQHWGIGAAVGLDVDVVRTTDRGAIYLGVQAGADLFPHELLPRTLSPVASLDLGVRF